MQTFSMVLHWIVQVIILLRFCIRNLMYLCLFVHSFSLHPSVTALPLFCSGYTALKPGRAAWLSLNSLWTSLCHAFLSVQIVSPSCLLKQHINHKHTQHTHLPFSFVSLRELYSSFKAQSVAHFHAGRPGGGYLASLPEPPPLSKCG